MELLYVWIEEYNNIYRQEFNFSPKHRFHFEPNEKEGPVTGGTLDHKPINPNYPDNFFGESISNITAIVGKNGSGKSSLIKAIIDRDAFLRSYIFFIYINNDGYHLIINNDSQFRNETGLSIEPSTESLFRSKMLYYSPFINSNRNIVPNSSNADISNASVLFQVNSRDSYNSNAKIASAGALGIYDTTIASYSAMEMTQQILFVSQVANILDIPFQFPRNVELVIPLYDSTPNEQTLINIIEEALKRYVIETLERDRLIHSPLYATLKNPLSENIFTSICSERAYNVDEIRQFANFLSSRISNFSKTSLGSVLKFQLTIDDILNLGILPAIEHVGEYEYRSPKNWVLDLGIRIIWRDLSDGEATLLSLLSRIWNRIEYSQNPTITLLDEFELGLHPDWQKKALSILISLFKTASFNGHHLLLTSHSPFLVSDLPRENIIFLDKDANGKCMVKEPEDMDRTFGANIHSLYRNSFFMDGMMGKFAEDKINKIIKDLNGGFDTVEEESKETRKKEMDYIIGQIGEPVIQGMLRKKYNDKFHSNGSLNERILKLEEELELLKQGRDGAN